MALFGFNVKGGYKWLLIVILITYYLYGQNPNIYSHKVRVLFREHYERQRRLLNI